MKLPRVYPILDTGVFVERGFSPTCAAAAFLQGGAGILQLRHKQHWGRAVFEAAREIARMCREAGALFIVDDRADIAMLLDAGLHVGQDDLPPRDARRLMGTDAIIGFSSHNVRQVCAAGGEPVDYVAFGPVFQTASKRNPDPVTGDRSIKGLPRADGKTAGGDRRHYQGDRGGRLGGGRGFCGGDRRPAAGRTVELIVAAADGRMATTSNEVKTA